MLGVLLAQNTSDAASEAAAAAGVTALAGIWLFVVIAGILVGIVSLGLWIWALVDLLKRDFENPNDRTTWLIVLIVGIVISGFMWLAAILYLIIGRKKGTLKASSGGAGSTTNPTT